MLNSITLETNKKTVFVDITDRVKSLVKGMDEGFVLVATSHTTTGLWINEAEKGLINDLKLKMESLFPSNEYYEHDNFEKRIVDKNERKNGFSHLRTLLFQSSIILPVQNGKILLGRYQSIFFVELDGPRMERKIIIQTLRER